MKSTFITLSTTALLASLAMSAPSIVVQGDVSHLTMISSCLSGISRVDGWSSSCAAAAGIPGPIKDIAVNELQFDIAGAHWEPQISSKVVATLNLRVGFLTAITKHIQVFYNGVEIARIETLSNPATVSGYTVTTSYELVPFALNPTARDAYSSLLKGLFTSKSETIKLKGTIDASFKIPILGDRTLHGFAIDNDIVLQGLDGMSDFTFVRYISEGYLNSIQYTASVQVNIKNPSVTRFAPGPGNDVSFSINFDGTSIGTMTFKDLTLELGDNFLTGNVVIDSSSQAGQDFMKAIDLGEVTVTLSGAEHTSKNPALVPAFQALRIRFVFPKKFGKP